MEKNMIKVLLVEDDEDDYKLTSELLSEIYGARLDLEWVDTYDTALLRLKAKSHDVYLLDYRLGEYSGLDILQAATVLDIQEPIILLTGQGNAELGREAMRMGAADYLVKGSIDAPLLERAVEYAIQRKEIQQTLQRQALTFNSIQDSVFFTNIGGEILDWNPAAVRLFGYSKTEALGQTSAFLHRPEDATAIALIIEECLREGGPWAGEVTYVCKDGTEALGQTIVALMFDEHGHASGMHTTNHDITESRRAEESLLHHVRRQAAIAELGQRALAYTHISDLMHDAAEMVAQTLEVEYSQIMELQAGGKRLLLTAGAGWLEGSVEQVIVGARNDSQAEYTLRSSAPVLVHDLRAETRFTDKRLLKKHKVLSGMSTVIMGKIEPYGVLGAHSTQTRVFSDDEAQFLQAVANTLALSVERKEAEEALRESEERFRMTWEIASDAIALSDPEGTVLFANPAYNKMYGFEPGAAVGQSFALIFPDEARRGAIDGYRDAFASNVAPPSFEASVMRTDGSERIVESRIGFLSNRGQRTAMLSIVRDITERKQAEQELRKSQERFSKAFKASPSPIAINRIVGGQFVDVNDSFVEVFGYSREELIGHKGAGLDFLVSKDNERLERTLRETGSVRQMETPVRVKSGAVLDVLFSAEVIDLEGEACLLSIIVDISERKKAEEALRLSSEILQRVNSLVLVSNKEGKITYASPSVKTMLGYEPQDLLGDGWWQVSRRASSEAEREIMQVKDVARSNDTVYREPYERLVLDHAGELHCILWQDVKGPGDQAIGVGHDITERKKAEKALIESDERYRAFVAHSSEGITRFESELPISIDLPVDEQIATFYKYGYMAECNDHMAQMYGFSRAEDVVGARLSDLLPPDDPDNVEYLRAFVENSYRLTDAESHELDAAGNLMYFSNNLIGMIEDGHLVRAWGTQRNITESKQIEEARLAKETAEQANQAKNEFLSRMSHELRTPLNAIIGFSQLLEMDELEPDQMESVGLVHKAGRHLLDLINEVLDISGIEAGHMSISPEPVSVAEVLGECLDLVKPLAADKNIMLMARKALQSNSYVLADRQRLKQIILNLLSNAIKYNQVGGTVGVSCDSCGEQLTPGIDTERVRILVRDTGSGIAQDELLKLFIPFERLDADQTGVEGTGLGLALSKRLAEMMGGGTGVESVVGQGSTFWVELPAADNPLKQIERFEGQYTTGPLQPVPPLGSTDQRMVLYIEDNSSNLRLIQHIFQQWSDIRLLSAMQGKLGFELACKHTPDLILLDLHLPDVHGDKVLEWLRQDPKTKDTPVIIITADVTPREASRLLEMGANAYITKPIDVRHFGTVVRATLEGKELTIARG
jgi:PAS domain S-box-containing protein